MNKYVVLVFSFRGIFTVEPKKVGFKTKSLKFAHFQAKLQKRFRKPGTPIAIGIITKEDAGFAVREKINLLEWIVPWVIEEAAQIDEPTHEHLDLINKPIDFFKD